MRIYCGRRNPETGRVAGIFVRETTTGREYELVEQPWPGTAGLEWRYAGAGPYNLARAILYDLLGEIPDWVGDFENKVVAALDESGFELSAAEIESWMTDNGYR